MTVIVFIIVGCGVALLSVVLRWPALRGAIFTYVVVGTMVCASILASSERWVWAALLCLPTVAFALWYAAAWKMREWELKRKASGRSLETRIREYAEDVNRLAEPKLADKRRASFVSDIDLPQKLLSLSIKLESVSDMYLRHGLNPEESPWTCRVFPRRALKRVSVALLGRLYAPSATTQASVLPGGPSSGQALDRWAPIPELSANIMKFEAEGRRYAFCVNKEVERMPSSKWDVWDTAARRVRVIERPTRVVFEMILVTQHEGLHRFHVIHFAPGAWLMELFAIHGRADQLGDQQELIEREREQLEREGRKGGAAPLVR